MKLPPQVAAVLDAAILASLCSPCLAQRSHGRGQGSGAATITLTATLTQSLSMSISPKRLPAETDDLLTDPHGNAPLTITTNWVRGLGNVSVQAFSPGNPLLGGETLAIVPVGTASPIPAGQSFSSAEKFLPASQTQSRPGLPGLRLNTDELQIPPGSDDAILTVRANAL